MGADASCLDISNGYRKITIKGRTFYAHRLIWTYHYGTIPPTRLLDHVNQDRCDNRIENLRLVDDTQNGANKRKQRNNTSGFTGVWYHKQRNKWTADVWSYRKKHYLGLFSTAEEANQAAIKKRKELGIFMELHGL